MRPVVKDGVGGFDHRRARARVLACIQVAVKAGKVAAAHLKPDSMSLQKHVARGPKIDLVLVDLAGNDGTGNGCRFAIAGAQYSLRKVDRSAIRSYVD